MNNEILATRSVESSEYHVWTDALHARELARQTPDRWDRGSYVRWSITSAWTAFEMACALAVGASAVGKRFKDELNGALEGRGVRLDWGSGIWQRVSEVQQLRIDYAHRHLPQARLFAETTEAERVIVHLRRALHDLYQQLGEPSPPWIDVDTSAGWEGPPRAIASATVLRQGAREDDPNAIRVVYVYRGKETVSEVLPADGDWQSVMRQLIETVVIPISTVRAYRGAELIREVALHPRGS